MRRRTLALLLIAAVAILASVIAAPDWPDFFSRAERVLERSGITGGGREPTGTSVRLPELPNVGWVNGNPLPREMLEQRPVVLVLFADTHPYSRAVLAHAQAWHDAYTRFDLQVIGVHVPEFAFAAAQSAAQRAVERFAITFPVLHDPALEMLGLMGRNTSGPHVALFAAGGALRSLRSITAPEELPGLEHEVRELVREANPQRAFPAGPGEAPPVTVGARALKRVRLGVPSVHSGPLAGADMGRAQPFTVAFRHEVEGALWVPHPVGWWTPGAEGLEAARGGAANFLAIRYDARRVGLVVAPPEDGQTRVYVLLDEEWVPAAYAGDDLRRDADGASYIEVGEPRLYGVLKDTGRHIVKMSPRDAGTTLYALTFEDAH